MRSSMVGSVGLRRRGPAHDHVERPEQRAKVLERAGDEPEAAEPLPEFAKHHRPLATLVAQPPDAPRGTERRHAQLEPAEVELVADPVHLHAAVDLLPLDRRAQHLEHEEVE